MEALDYEDIRGVCIRDALPEQVRLDIEEAVETVMGKGTEARSRAEWEELTLAEAEAIARRRQFATVATCPHCGEVLPPSSDQF